MQALLQSRREFGISAASLLYTAAGLRAQEHVTFKSLNDALSEVDTPSRQELSVPSSKGTVLYDAIVKVSKEVMQDQHGRKALILLTDGVDVGSDADLMDAIEAAQRADTLVYSILFSDPGAYGFLPFGVPDGAGALKRISMEPGAVFFEVSKKHGIDRIFD